MSFTQDKTMAHIGVLENITPQSMMPELEPIIMYHSDIIPAKGQLMLLGKRQSYEVVMVILNPNNEMGLTEHPEVDILVVCQKCQPDGLDIQQYL